MAALRGTQWLTNVFFRQTCCKIPKVLSAYAMSSASASSPEVSLRHDPLSPNIPVRPAFTIRLPPKFLSHEPEEEVDIQEYFIPVTRSSIVRYLLEEPDFLNNNEKSKFEQFATALDHVVSLHFVGVQEELKQLFTPLNPSAETMNLRKMSVRDRLDNEFWLLQKLSVILERANFFEVPQHVVGKITRPKPSSGIKVCMDRDKYAVLRIWAIGRELAHLPMPWYEYFARSLISRYFPKVEVPPRRPQKYLKRVVAAVRLKAESRLQLKAFRDVPASRLHTILPDGQFAMGQVRKTLTAAGCAATVVGSFAQIVCTMAGTEVMWPLTVAFVSGVATAGLWIRYREGCVDQLAEMHRTQFFKSVAGGRSLLDALVFRARAESFKEALLVYTFLLTQRVPSVHAKKSHQHKLEELGGITQPVLEKTIEAWARRVFGVSVDFDAHESIRLLETLGLVRRDVEGEDRETLQVQPLDVAVRTLPAQPASVTLASEEGDILEGYDKDVMLDDLLREERRLKRYGWG